MYFYLVRQYKIKAKDTLYIPYALKNVNIFNCIVKKQNATISRKKGVVVILPIKAGENLTAEKSEQRKDIKSELLKYASENSVTLIVFYRLMILEGRKGD